MPATLTHTHTHTQHHVPWLLIFAVAIVFVVILTFALGPSITIPAPSLIPATGNQNANELFRQEELMLYNRTSSSVGSESFYEYRMGEWPVKQIDARYEFRRGEWFGN